jgi:hypothetical protein
VTDTDRLAALLAPMLPKYPNEWTDPEDIASDLIAAGVTLAPTPPDALREAAQAVVDTRDCYERAFLPSPLIVRIDALRAALEVTP